MITIVFTGNDPAPLQALEACARQATTPWQLVHCVSGAKALTAVEDRNADVLVSAMQLPDMTGRELLLHIRARFPKVVRVALTDTTAEELAHEAHCATHRCLVGDVPLSDLQQAIEHSIELRKTLKRETLVETMSSVRSLPALPGIYQELMGELASDDMSMARLGAIIESDMGLSATLLRIVNSAYYGIFRHIESPAQATTLLGAELIKNIALADKVFSMFSGDARTERELQALNEQANRAGAAANGFARLAQLPKRRIDHCQMAGMLSEVGVLLMCTILREHPRVLDNTVQPASIGGYLLGTWNLPDAVVEAVTYQFEPPRVATPRSNVAPATVLQAIRLFQASPGDASLTAASILEPLGEAISPELAAAWQGEWHARFADPGDFNDPAPVA